MIKMEFSHELINLHQSSGFFFGQKKAPPPLSASQALTFRKLYRRSAKGLETNLGSKHLDTLQLGTFMDGRKKWRKLMLWRKRSSATDTPKTSEEEEDTCFIVSYFFSIGDAQNKSWHVSGGAFFNQQKWRKGMNYFPSTSCNWLVSPRYCQSKLAQVLKTRGYAQEAEQLLQRVVRGVMKLHSVT